MQNLSDRAVESLPTSTSISRSPAHVGMPHRADSDGRHLLHRPSEDLTVPAAMWWSVPPGVDAFHTWQETTTVFHEGVPGIPQMGGGRSSRRSD
jgi:uncharacterized protein (DUF885 family)